MISIYSIGHGRHPFAYFLELLQKFEIEFVCDVRSFPRSRWPQYNLGVLHELLVENGIGYEHIPETGGKTKPSPERAPARGGARQICCVSSVSPTNLSERDCRRGPECIGKPERRAGTAQRRSGRFNGEKKGT